MSDDQPVHRTPCALVFLAWLIVCIPAAWGVTQTVMKSLDLFKSAPPKIDLRSQIGQSVHLEGRFDGPGKEADYLVVGENVVYLKGNVDSGGSAVPYQSLVAVDGILRFQEFTPASQPSSRVPVQMPFDHFYIDNPKMQVRPPLSH